MLLITIDTWRWDHVGAAGRGAVVTPVLDRLASEGLYVRQAQSPCPLTTPAHATIMTGLVPYRHGIRDNAHFTLVPGVKTLAEAMRDGGYATWAVISGAPLKKDRGLARGFESYDDTGLDKEDVQGFVPAQRPAPETNARAVALLRSAAETRPVFLWVHYYDVHYPYKPPEPFRSSYPRNPYAGEVAYVDFEIGQLLDAAFERSPRWVVVVTGDHGEGLRDHGELTHGLTLYESTIEVPLIVWPRPAGVTVPTAPVGLVDVTPTLCQLAGVAGPPCDGKDILGPIPSDRWLCSESSTSTLAFGLNPILAMRRGDRIWIHHGAEEVYDLAADAGQREDVSKQEASFIAEASRHMPELFGSDPLASILAPTLTPSSEEVAALRSLGYVGGSVPKSASELTAMDIREFVPQYMSFMKATAAFDDKRYQEAYELTKAFVDAYPRAPKGQRELGLICVALKDAEQAGRAFTAAVELDPTDADSFVNLGSLAVLRGDRVAARGLYERAIALREDFPEAHLNLGLITLDGPEFAAVAVPHLKRFLELSPQDPDAPKVRAELAKRGAS